MIGDRGEAARGEIGLQMVAFDRKVFHKVTSV